MPILVALAGRSRLTQARNAPRPRIDGQIGFTAPGLLVFNGQRSIAVTGLDGKLIARDRWPRTPVDNLDSGLSVSPDGRTFAFRLTDSHPGAHQGEAVVYVLHAGQSHARAIYRHTTLALAAASSARGWNGTGATSSTAPPTVTKPSSIPAGVGRSASCRSSIECRSGAGLRPTTSTGEAASGADSPASPFRRDPQATSADSEG